MNLTVPRSDYAAVAAWLHQAKPDRHPVPLTKRRLAQQINHKWGQLRRRLKGGAV